MRIRIQKSDELHPDTTNFSPTCFHLSKTDKTFKHLKIFCQAKYFQVFLGRNRSRTPAGELRRAAYARGREGLTALSERFRVISVKLDRSHFKQQSFAEAADHQAAYQQMSAAERAKSFRHLMQVNYGFLGQDWPRMDKTLFSKRLRK